MYFSIKSLQKDELILEFPPNVHEESRNRLGQGLPSLGCFGAETLIGFVFKMKKTDDYDLERSSGYQTIHWEDRIRIKGRMNVIFALDLFLNQAKEQFSLSYDSMNNQTNWSSKLHYLMFEAIDDNKTLKVIELERLKPLLKTILDNAFEQLSNDSLVKPLKLTVDAGLQNCNYQTHSFFQLLGLFFEDQQRKIAEYDKKTFLQRFTQARPDTLLSELSNKYIKMGLIPPTFIKDTKPSGRIIDFEKILTTVRQPVQTQIPLGLNM